MEKDHRLFSAPQYLRAVHVLPLGPDDAEHVLELRQRLDAEVNPDDPPIGQDELLRQFQAGDEYRKSSFWRAVDGGTTVGMASLELFYADNLELAEVTVEVDPGHRREGYGTALLIAAAELAASEGRSSLLAWGIRSEASAGFWTGFAASEVQVERDSRVVLADTDSALMDDWIVRAQERAAGYHLEFWRDRCPDELLDRFAEIKAAMNDAPLDEIEMEDFVRTPEIVRAREQYSIDLGLERWDLLAVDDDTGEAAGMTEILINLGSTVNW